MLPVFLAADGFMQIRPGLIFWTLVTFLLVFFVLRAKAWKPILDLVGEREKQISAAIESAKRERAEAERLLADQKTAIAEARREATEMMRKNHADMERIREELLAKSRKDADELKLQARREIDEQKNRALAEVKAMVVDLAINIAEKLLGEKLDDSKHRSLAEQYIEQLPKSQGTQPSGVA